MPWPSLVLIHYLVLGSQLKSQLGILTSSCVTSCCLGVRWHGNTRLGTKDPCIFLLPIDTRYSPPHSLTSRLHRCMTRKKKKKIRYRMVMNCCTLYPSGPQESCCLYWPVCEQLINCNDCSMHAACHNSSLCQVGMNSSKKSWSKSCSRSVLNVRSTV